MEPCCGTCLHGGKNYWTGECRLSRDNPKKKDMLDYCGAWHQK